MTAELLYLSGGARVSTRPDTESLGPRSHVLGVVNAFTTLGFRVRPYIVGDEVPERFGQEGSEAALGRSRASVLLADLARFALRWRSRARLRRRLPVQPLFAYERYALFQDLGRTPQRRGVPWVLEVNALLADESTGPRRTTTSRRLARHFERRTFARADLLIAVTAELKAALVGRYQIDQDKVLVLANGVDASRFDGVRPTDGTPTDEPTIVFVGTLYPWQGLDQLIRALALPGRARPRLVIAGDGPEEQPLRALVHELGLDDRVTFCGRVHPDEVGAVLERADVCFAGHHAARGTYFSPLKLWEYLAAGKPVLSSRHAMAAELIEDGYALRCFEESSPSSIRDALDDVVADVDKLTALADAGRERVRRQHSWEARVRALLAELETRGLVPAADTGAQVS